MGPSDSTKAGRFELPTLAPQVEPFSGRLSPLAKSLAKSKDLDEEDWSALADDFRTLLLVHPGSESIFQQLTI